MDSDEVRKRKEYAERKVKERHAALRKEAEERRKHTIEHRERVQSVLKREQVLLQKRMQQLNEDEERKKATLAKQHEATSRIAAITKSPKSFAFGSSTPRTLAYLDNLPKSEQQYDKKLRPLEGSSHVTSPTATSPTTAKTHRIAATPQRAPPASHRPAPTMTSMTSSMYVTSSAPPTRHSKTLAKPSTATSKRLSQAPSSMMTQSVYTPSRPATTSRLSMGGRMSTPRSSKPSQPAPFHSRRSMDVTKPPIHKKHVLGNTEAKKAATPSQTTTVPKTTEMPNALVEETKHVEHAEERLDHPIVEPIVEEQVSEIATVQEETPDRVETSVEQAEIVEETSKEVEEAHVVPEAALIGEIEKPTETIPETASAEQAGVVPPVETEENEEGHSSKNFVKEIPIVESADVKNPHHQEQDASVAGVADEDDHVEKATIESPVSKQEEHLLHEDTSESNVGSSVNTSLAEELITVETEQKEMEEQSKPEVMELNYPLPEEVSVTASAPTIAAVNDLVDVFGNDFINQNAPQRVEFDEETDSGKASPTSSETSSTTDEVTPRNDIEDVKLVTPRIMPVVRSAEDIARKEKEAREAEERKARLAEILAKSRGMASPMTNTLPPTAADIKDSTQSTTVTAPPTQSPPLPQSTQQELSSTNASTEESSNESGRGSDVLARIAAMTNSSALQKVLQRKQGSNPSLQTSESTGGEIY